MTLNRTTIIGNLTRDPESRTTPSGVTVTNFSVATSLVWNDQSGQRQEIPEYHNIVAWRKLAEICAQYLRKGRKVYVEGRLQTRSWDDPNGFKRYKTEIVAQNMIMLDRAPEGSYSAPAPQAQSVQPQAADSPDAQPASDDSAQAPSSLPTDNQEKTEPQVPVVDSETPAQSPSQSSQDDGQEEVSVEEIPF